MNNKILTDKFNGDYLDHVFGQEKTVEEIVRRIAWEREAEGLARAQGHGAIADGHALARAAYTDLLKRA